MTANQYAEKVISNFLRRITDHVFLYIERDEDLMRQYQTQVNKNSLQEVNMAIGKRVKKMFRLNDDGICHKPKSRLIKDFTFHKK